MIIPFEPKILNVSINVHLILEYLAFFVGFRYFVYLRKNSVDEITKSNRLSLLIGAIFGALIGSRLVGYLEHPVAINLNNFLVLSQVKTIMGGLFGGLLGVELSKKLIGERKSSGDLFTLPLIVGIFIGRIGCFLNGMNEFTYGIPTHFIMGMDLGDGITRHPLALYEIIFLLGLFIMCRRIRFYLPLPGDLFKIFMIFYFGFRFIIEFLKPNEFFIASLSTIQWLCIVCWIYYFNSIKRLGLHAYKRLYLL